MTLHEKLFSLSRTFVSIQKNQLKLATVNFSGRLESKILFWLLLGCVTTPRFLTFSHVDFNRKNHPTNGISSQESVPTIYPCCRIKRFVRLWWEFTTTEIIYDQILSRATDWPYPKWLIKYAFIFHFDKSVKENGRLNIFTDFSRTWTDLMMNLNRMDSDGMEWYGP